MRGVRKRKNVLAILSLGIGLCVQHVNAASAENLFVRVSSSTPGVREVVSLGDDFYVTTRDGGARFHANISVVAKSPWILIEPSTGSLVLGVGKSGQYRVHDDSGSEDEPNGSITVLKLDIEQVETNICWKERSCVLKLTDDSYPGGDVIWSSSPSGISGRGRSIRFNPSSLRPGEYEVRAHSEKVDSLDDVCLVRIVLSEFIIFVDQPGAGGDRDTYEWVNGDIDVGHVFWLYTNSYPVVVKDTQLRSFVNQYTGYYPRESVKIGTSVAGRFVMPDIGHLGTYEVSHFWGISLAQLMRGLQYSINLQNNPGTYDLEDNNCTDAAIAAGAAVGVQVPDTQGSWLTGRGSNPGDLGEDLRQLNGSGN